MPAITTLGPGGYPVALFGGVIPPPTPPTPNAIAAPLLLGIDAGVLLQGSEGSLLYGRDFSPSVSGYSYSPTLQGIDINFVGASVGVMITETGIDMITETGDDMIIE